MFSKTDKTGSMTSIFSRDLVIEGNVRISGDLQMDGTVVGDVSGELIVIGQDGRAEGSVQAKSVRIYGTVSGNISAGTVYIAETARVEGDISHGVLSIESGAHVDGRIIRIQTPESEESIQIEDGEIVHSSGWIGRDK